MSGRSVLDEAIAGSGRVGARELEELNHAMADPDRAGDMDRILERFGDGCRRNTNISAATRSRARRAKSSGLGFDDERIDGDVGALSGGWKMRVAMAVSCSAVPTSC